MKQYFYLVVFMFAACALAAFTTNKPTNITLSGYSFSSTKPTNIALSGFNYSTNRSTNIGLSGFSFTTNAPSAANTPGDADATDFCLRAGITNQNEAVAVDALVRQLKAANLWTNFYALYPFVGGTSNSASVNLVSSNYRITWFGAPPTNIFTTNGVYGNGSSFGGDTGFNPVTAGMLTNDFHFFSWHDNRAGSLGVMLGANDLVESTVFRELQMGYKTNYGGYASFYHDDSTNVAQAVTLLDTNFHGGNLLFTQKANQAFLFSTNGVQRTNGFHYDFFANTNLYAFAEHNGQTDGALRFQKGEVRAMSFGYGMSTNQATNYFAIISRFQSYLNRATP